MATQPELLAHHYTAAGHLETAIDYWQRAGQRALERSANLEAIGHLQKGLDLLVTLPDTPTRAQQELRLQIPFGAAMLVTKGHGAPEVATAYSRARELCQQADNAPQIFPVLLGLWRFYVIAPQLRTNRELAEQLLDLAQRQQDPPLLVVAHYVLGATFTFLGDMAPARLHLEAGYALYDPGQRRTHAFLYGAHDPGVACLAYLAWALWHLGYPEQALATSRASLDLAQDLAHPFTQAFAMAFASRIHQLCRDSQGTQQLTEACITLSVAQGFPLWEAMATIIAGWASSMHAPGQDAIALLHQGMTAWRATGADLSRSYWLGLLAEAYGQLGRPQEALDVLPEALEHAHDTEERWWEAELHRLQGEMLVHADNKTRDRHWAAAETCFHRALNVARQQQARSLELRATMSLARLWQQQGRADAAYQLLAPLYSWFTEGFDMPDVGEARALLQALRRGDSCEQ